DGNGAVSNTVTVTVTNAPVPATSIAIKYNGRVLADNETVEIAVGSSITLEPTVEPSDASVTDSDFEWDVDPYTFYTESGRNITVTPSETGVYTITVTVDSLGVRCRLNVVEREPEGIDVTDISGNLSGQVSVQESGTVTLQASVTPAGAAYLPSDIRWTVTAGNASLSATTGETVTVTGRSAGTVTVKASIGSYETFYNITVTAAPAPADGGGGGGCSTGPATGFALLIMSIIPMLCRKKK
ncbi:MAG: Ig-like domain-containing protein, partial [Acholeplasmataceae bacterium]|nr:Ig-like domain-containing protein [Acholeplasmataceae bacterium]